MDDATGPRFASAEPSSMTSRQIRESVPACGSIAECHFSAPAREARHWKNMAPSLPRATWPRLSRSNSPGALARLRGCQFTAPVECSMSSHGRPPPRDRVRSPAKAMSTCGSGWVPMR
ncbi:MAG: hypothetical protein AUG44_20410 [Actinobacteria bacterium 13_1_20CM_3_71_11]|nr:MAG: hypothetical protein AUG44_20410 [Actinobacteria bacterium 13_1_20CM_3_71_11]